MGSMPQMVVPSREVDLPPCGLTGELALPPAARGLVVFAHGQGSSHASPRNWQVARALQARGLATLLFDLVLPDEIAVGARVVTDLIAQSDRLVDVLSWIAREPELKDLPCGLYGASTGGAVALVAAARVQSRVRAVVTRAGRLDLARPVLSLVRTPTLLLVGSADVGVLDMNRKLIGLFAGPAALEVVTGANHLFEEEGALDTVARLAGDWFLGQLCPDAGRGWP